MAHTHTRTHKTHTCTRTHTYTHVHTHTHTHTQNTHVHAHTLTHQESHIIHVWQTDCLLPCKLKRNIFGTDRIPNTDIKSYTPRVKEGQHIRTYVRNWTVTDVRTYTQTHTHTHTYTPIDKQTRIHTQNGRPDTIGNQIAASCAELDGSPVGIL